MISRIELGKKILEELPKSPDEWITVQSLEDVKLGNFAWKSQRDFFMRIFPPFAKYHYETATEKLEEYLQRRNDDVKFELKEKRSSMSLSATAYASKLAGTLDLMKGRLRGGYQNSYQETIPATDFIITRIKRRDLEQSLNLWKLDMTSSYINVKKRKNDIPCIISAIVEAATPEDQPDTMASVEKKRRIEGNVQLDSPSGISDVFDSVKPKGNIVSETCKKTEGYIKGPVLYNVLPLEIDPTGHIEAKEDSEGFLEDTVVADSASGNFSSSMYYFNMVVRRELCPLVIIYREYKQ
ncbi:uncharacterized protein LOC110449363 isoform X2 [Mizuhopecten yessoensis]|nr:uncharacterized protein LOC110449363 isoform X2 [Mizuhopecten yessoensis]XP_021351858.1 uncharacterized protein LOC110449363 isoform X2 [Mizuhopecten yessoensis]XP_021351859.1 uncharacterized protein LOC110449363 isoform X2 [Mizuhopecten yessoensis]XP_021351860.1 uncharacterized protein LOC110449363 isoform X2 [Mizuhopecten yessoensis]XP_021351861.1 uncharacterized protein LOC110449363 isoform X2 [Mizuhopecten yessoensis]XP_021351862.1 uncharacterized protein LOC110449363 isoform X2 [Mizuho